MSYQLDRVKFTSTDTGTGSSITVAARYSTAYFTPAQAGAVNGRRYTYFIQQGNDVEIQQDQVYTAGTTSFARGTPVLSVISGTVGTTQITLDTTQTVAVGASSADLMFSQTRGADVASASTLVLDTTTGKTVNLTGTTGISTVTLADGQERIALYTGAGLTITVGSNLIGNAGGANITLATGDIVVFKGFASSIVRFSVIRTSGKSVVPPAFADLTSTPTTLSGYGITDGGGVAPPQGRLTLVTATPIMTTTQSAKTTIFYTPHIGNQVPIYNGTSMISTAITELSVATTDTTKSPAAIGASKVNDWYVWNDSGTLRLSHGPDRASDTTVGDFVRVGGILLNNTTITNGPAASRGTYVGTTRSNSSSQLDWIYGTYAAPPVAAWFGVWNAYNRVQVTSQFGEITDSWTYGTGTWRAANNSTTWRASYVVGLPEDPVDVRYNALLTGTTGTINAVAGIGVDITTAYTGSTAWGNITNVIVASPATYSGIPGTGFHFIAPIEYAAGGTATFYGDIGVAYMQAAFSFSLKM